jgi:TrmH RNA methyltransferase
MTRRTERREMIYGVNAVRAVFDMRRDDIERIARARAIAPALATLIRWAGTEKVQHDILPDRELDRIAQSTHHEGIIIATRPRTWMSPIELALSLGSAVVVDGVANPHNVGAIVRTAAFFAFDGVLVAAPADHPAMTPAAARVAQGGAERLMLARTHDLPAALDELARRGIAVVGADPHAKIDLAEHEFQRPVAVVVGSERDGLAAPVRARCKTLVAIRGGGAVESLNVAVAAGIVMAAVARTHPDVIQLEQKTVRRRP